MQNNLMTHVSHADIQGDANLQRVFGVPLGMLDPLYPGLTDEDRYKILDARYRHQLISDGLETGHFVLGGGGEIAGVRTGLPLYSFLVYVLEAYMVKTINDDKLTVGRKAFEWCTRRLKSKQSYILQWTAIGTGHVTTKSNYPFYYSPQSNMDIIFLRKNKRVNLDEQATVNGTKIVAGFQVKAITGGEREEIIEPLRAGKYGHVLTCLRHETGVTSHSVCVDIINTMYKNGEIGLGERDRLAGAVYSPEMLGIDQRNIEEYKIYVHHWYNGRAATTDVVLNAVGLEVKNWKYKGGILMPSSDLII